MTTFATQSNVLRVLSGRAADALARWRLERRLAAAETDAKWFAEVLAHDELRLREERERVERLKARLRALG